MKHVKCIASHPVDLDDGRILARGESGQIDETTPHNAALIDGGALLELEDDTAVKRRRTGASTTEEDNA